VENAAAHWQRRYSENPTDSLSWTEDLPRTSLELIEEAALPGEAAIVDIGGGASRLAGELIQRGYGDLTVADISAKAMEQARADLGEDAARVRWVEADVRSHDFGRHFDLWHDRAVFHFMVEEADREAYLAVLDRSLKPGGHLILATFGPHGPTECSGLPVRRYDATDLADLLSDYDLLSCRQQDHRTPSGNLQQFIYAHLRRRGSE
jgi:SAM-dependent methyltransferase